MNKKNIFFVLVLIILLLSIFNIQNSKKIQSNNNNEKILNLAIPSDVTTYDPIFSTDVTSGQMLSKIFEKLVNFNEQLEIIPELAETFEVNLSCTEFNFKLRPNIYFSDGKTLLTAQIVKQSLLRLANPSLASPRANIIEKIIGYDEYVSKKSSDIDGIIIKNDYEITIKIKEPFAPFLYNLAMVPASITLQTDNGIIGTGPFYLLKSSDGSKIILKKNSFYHSKDLIYIDEIVYKIIHDPMTQVSEFELKNLDILNLTSANLKYFLQKKDINEKYNIHKQPKLNVYYIAFNHNKEIFTENVKKALNMAINKKEIINTLLKDTMIESKGPFPPTLNAYDPDLKGYDYNPQLAKEILAKENTKELKFDIYYRATAENEDIMQLIKEDLSKVGVNVTLKKMEWAALRAEIVKGNLPAYYLNWSADFPDAHNFLIPLFHSKNKGIGGNRAFFEDKALDIEMDNLEKIADNLEYKKMAKKIQQEIVNKAPWIFLWHEIEYAVSQKYVEGYNVPKIYSMENFKGIKLNK